MSKKAKNFGSLTFSDASMRRHLSHRTYTELQDVIKKGKALDISIADEVAEAMKSWALDNGATHYAHWFQPLTGLTSEKHESFMTPELNGTALLTFSAKDLVQSEPDASSFPSGGLRQTFEARGYTAWDPTSPVFIKDEVLCIPTVFFSYTKESLDKKTPLLRSLVALNKEAKRALTFFGKQVDHVECMVGPEQEYFLIKMEDYLKRTDLRIVGRTLFGAMPIKGQELNDHYFGSITPDVNSFMKDLDDELWMRGVPATTKHNEVAPCQHELAPMYERANVAIDHNLLTMEIMKAVAPEHGFACLLNEKPFAYINGSGKHDNWSISADGSNLLDPTETPESNLQFLVFLTAVIAAVDNHQDLLRASIGTYDNDFRLGGDEAPPSIVSVSLGNDLDEIVKGIMDNAKVAHHKKERPNSGIPQIADVLYDTSDRNRTSPFAFTGNKFEFRMPGSRLNLSSPNMILNTGVAESLRDFSDTMQKVPKKDFEAKAYEWVRKTLKAHERILFSKDGYSKTWREEAIKRGLDNFKSSPEAFESLMRPENVDFFKRFEIMNESEVYARYVAKQEAYAYTSSMEIKTMLTMVNREYLPAMKRYAKELAEEIIALKSSGCTVREAINHQVQCLNEYEQGIIDVVSARNNLNAEWITVEKEKDISKRNAGFVAKIKPLMDSLREKVDKLEIITPTESWPVASYDQILRYGGGLGRVAQKYSGHRR